MNNASEIIWSYKVSLTRTKPFDAAENTGYTTHGVLVTDNEDKIVFQRQDYHTNSDKVHAFIAALLDPDHLAEVAEGYLDGCDDLDLAGGTDKAGELSLV